MLREVEKLAGEESVLDTNTKEKLVLLLVITNQSKL